MESLLSNKIKDFSSFKVTATQVVKNSLPDTSLKMANTAGTFLATISTVFTKKNEKINNQSKF